MIVQRHSIVQCRHFLYIGRRLSWQQPQVSQKQVLNEHQDCYPRLWHFQYQSTISTPRSWRSQISHRSQICVYTTERHTATNKDPPPGHTNKETANLRIYPHNNFNNNTASIPTRIMQLLFIKTAAKDRSRALCWLPIMRQQDLHCVYTDMSWRLWREENLQKMFCGKGGGVRFVLSGMFGKQRGGSWNGGLKALFGFFIWSHWRLGSRIASIAFEWHSLYS